MQEDEKAGFDEGAFEVKKKMTTYIKAAVMLIITENILALRNIIRTIIESASKLAKLNGGSILPGNKKKG